jgi:hypothetical protein
VQDLLSRRQPLPQAVGPSSFSFSFLLLLDIGVTLSPLLLVPLAFEVGGAPGALTSSLS